MKQQNFIIILLLIEISLIYSTTISTCQELQNINLNLTDCYLLINNIDCVDFTSFQPISNNTNPFLGVFQGNNFTISNLVISSSNPYTSLFGYGQSAVIKNTLFKNITITSSSNYLGIVFGFASGSIIYNCHLKLNSIINIGGSTRFIGGLCGELSSNSNMTSCTIENTIITANQTDVSDVGGIVGRLQISSILNNCFNLGFSSSPLTTIIKANNASKVGAIVGSCSSCSITQCGSLTGTIKCQDRCSGIVGSVISPRSLSQLFSNTAIIASGDDVAGLIGYLYLFSTQSLLNITNCYSRCDEIQSNNYGAGLIGKIILSAAVNCSLKIQNCYVANTTINSKLNSSGLVIGEIDNTAMKLVTFQELYFDNETTSGVINSIGIGAASDNTSIFGLSSSDLATTIHTTFNQQTIWNGLQLVIEQNIPIILTSTTSITSTTSLETTTTLESTTTSTSQSITTSLSSTTTNNSSTITTTTTTTPLQCSKLLDNFNNQQLNCTLINDQLVISTNQSHLINQKQLNLDNLQQTVINSNFTNQGTLSFVINNKTQQTPLLVTGCLVLNGTVQLVVTNNSINTVKLITYNQSCNTLINNAKLELIQPYKDTSCDVIKSSLINSQHSILASFTSSNCNMIDRHVIIILSCTIPIVVIAITLFIILLARYRFNKLCDQKVKQLRKQYDQNC